MFFRQSILLILFLSFSFIVLAHKKTGDYYIDNHLFESITQKDKWSFDGAAIYLRTRNTIQDNSVNFDFSWGYVLNAVHHFTLGKSINIKWIRYTGENALPHIDPNTILGIRMVITGVEAQSLDVLNVNLRQEMVFIDHMMLVLFGGVQYFSYTKQIDMHLRSAPATSDYALDTTAKGIGPRIGLGIDYTFFNYFTFSVDAAYSSIIDRRGRSLKDQTITQVGTTPLTLHTEKDESGPIGGFEGTMTLGYEIKLHEGTLRIQGGLMGISFDMQDTKYEGFTFGASWLNGDL